MEQENNFFNKENFNNIRTIAIYGDTGTGKTALSFKILELFKDRDIYFFKHPKPFLLKEFGYKNINDLEKLEKIRDCILYIDEPQIYFNIYNKKSNHIIAKICSLARQLNIILILSSSDTRVFTKHNESYFDLWIIKDVDYDLIKNGSKIKKAIIKNTLFIPQGFKLEMNEFLIDCRKLDNLNGIHTFKLPDKWNDKLSKPFNKY